MASETLIGTVIVMAFMRIMALVVSAETPDEPAIEDCTDFTDILTACSGTIADIRALILGTIEGIHPLINVIIGTFSIIIFIISIFYWGRAEP